MEPSVTHGVIQLARIVGLVQYRQGDGTNTTIRLGPCEIEETAMDATISWHDGDSNGAAAMPLSDYKRLVASKAIVIEGAKPP